MKTTRNVITIAVTPLRRRLCQRSALQARSGRTVPPPQGGGCCNCLHLLLYATAFAQNADNIANREVQRRQAAMPAGEAALARGKTAMRSKNYTVAYQEFKTAVGYLPDAVVSGRAHDEAADGACKSGTVLAEARIAQGDYAGAEAILNEILTRYDPNCRKAQELLAHMRQPGYFNKSVDAGFINKVEHMYSKPSTYTDIISGLERLRTNCLDPADPSQQVERFPYRPTRVVDLIADLVPLVTELAAEGIE